MPELVGVDIPQLVNCSDADARIVAAISTEQSQYFLSTGRILPLQLKVKINTVK